MKKILKLEPSATLVLDKISAVDISNENPQCVRVFMSGVKDGYYINCGSEEGAKKLYNQIINALEEINE